MQSSLSRLVEFVHAHDAGVPYEVEMAAHEGHRAVNRWTDLRAALPQQDDSPARRVAQGIATALDAERLASQIELEAWLAILGGASNEAGADQPNSGVPVIVERVLLESGWHPLAGRQGTWINIGMGCTRAVDAYGALALEIESLRTRAGRADQEQAVERLRRLLIQLVNDVRGPDAEAMPDVLAARYAPIALRAAYHDTQPEEPRRATTYRDASERLRKPDQEPCERCGVCGVEATRRVQVTDDGYSVSRCDDHVTQCAYQAEVRLDEAERLLEIVVSSCRRYSGKVHTADIIAISDFLSKGRGTKSRQESEGG